MKKAGFSYVLFSGLVFQNKLKSAIYGERRIDMGADSLYDVRGLVQEV